ncbi:O-antigen ligase family protein [bacterium]|nr:O-antigen ligase family protein [bacterium]
MRKRILFLFLTLVYGAGLFFFYFKYVPQIRVFQLILLPVLLAAFVLTAVRIQWGTLFFVFCFPLINSLPYFFGVFERTPHAPTALVLFLFYFLGWLLHGFLFSEKQEWKTSLSKPLFLFSVMIGVSAVITFFRFANFWPFLTEHIYELLTNVHGVSAGGAIMSTLFFSLNYLTGFAFLFILLNSIKSQKFIQKILGVLILSTGISLVAGYLQQFVNPTWGNTPMRVNEGIVNATFKDPLSFGAFLSVLLPILLAGVFFWKGFLRWFSGLGFFLALFILPRSGSKSGLIGGLLSIVLFGVLFFFRRVNWRQFRPTFLSRRGWALGTVFLILAVVVSLWAFTRGSESFKRLTQKDYKYGNLAQTLRMRKNQWRMASFMMGDYPLSGVGVGAYIIELPNYIQTHQGGFKKWTDSAENYFFQAGSEMGIGAVLLSLWIFWEILRLIKFNLKEHLASSNRWKTMQIGLSCGVFSLMLNFLVHTYIGSYEIKYTFWLVVALLLVSLRISGFTRGKKKWSRAFKTGSLVFLLLFSGLHLWNSTHSLSLEHRSQKVGIEQNFGFYKWERTPHGREFRWSRRYAGLTIPIKKPVVQIPLLASHPHIQKRPVRVKIYLVEELFRKKNLLEEVVLEKSTWKTSKLRLPQQVGSRQMLFFEVSRTWNPQKAKGVSDPRNLGVAVGKISFKSRPH